MRGQVTSRSVSCKWKISQIWRKHLPRQPILTGSANLCKPAAKVFETGTLVNALNKMAAFDCSMSAYGIAGRCQCDYRGLWITRSSIVGIIIVSTAVMAARIGSQNAAEKPLAIPIAMPSPPSQYPTSAHSRGGKLKLSRSWLIKPISINSRLAFGWRSKPTRDGCIPEAYLIIRYSTPNYWMFNAIKSPLMTPLKTITRFVYACTSVIKAAVFTLTVQTIEFAGQ